jgi:hypothetical protein
VIDNEDNANDAVIDITGAINLPAVTTDPV